jgi:diketogulonate reductase-like aldo/keto reductase
MSNDKLHLTLNNGVRMPALGLGVYQSTPEQTATAIESAVAHGYRLIDTAAAYFNERQVGEGIRVSGVSRAELFVTTKLWMSEYGYEQALAAFEKSRRKLGLDYVDLYLLHWPVPQDFDATVESYRAAEKLLSEGRVRAIGVCNFSTENLVSLAARTKVTPAVNQVELHPFFIQKEVRDYDTAHGIITQAWSPIGGVNRYGAKDAKTAKDPLAHPVIANLAERYQKTAAQVTLRWQIEHGLSAVPKSVRAERIAENIDIFDFALTDEEVAAIDSLDTGKRGGPNPEQVSPQLFNLSIPD